MLLSVGERRCKSIDVCSSEQSRVWKSSSAVMIAAENGGTSGNVNVVSTSVLMDPETAAVTAQMRLSYDFRRLADQLDAVRRARDEESEAAGEDD